MKHLYLVLILCFLNVESKAQIYGNTGGSYITYWQPNQIVCLRIETGSGDSGLFTHLAIGDALGNNCAIKLALYEHNVATNKPGSLLTDIEITSPTDGAINQILLSTQPTLNPSTYYWLSLRVSCQYNAFFINSLPWPLNPVHYDFENYGLAWPDPYTGNSTFSFSLSPLIFAVGNDQVLPVEMLSFDVDLEENKPLLKWKVASEINNDGWHIQRSVNGFTWESIDWVEGNGNSSDERDYLYMDDSPIYNLVFYRLEQKDFDGTIAHSEVKSVMVAPTGISIFPNPTSDFIEIIGPHLGQNYYILNTAGERILEGKFNTNAEKVNISHLEAGTYFIDIVDINYKDRFIKN